MSYQQSFFTGEQLAETGLNIAVDHANQEIPKWSERIYAIFKNWLWGKPAGYWFMIEDFRIHCEAQKLIESPPSKRAFGFISQRAAKEDLIFQRGTAKVKNPNAHTANAAVWVKK